MYIKMLQIEQTVSRTEKKLDPSFHSWEELVTSYLQGEGRWGVKPQSKHRVAMATFHPWWKTQPILVRMRGARPPPFTISTIKCKVVVRVYATAERADTLLLFLFFPYMYSVEQTVSEREKIGSFISQLTAGDVILAGGGRCGVKPQKTHRVAMATFWRIFHHDGKLSPSWWGWGVHAQPLSLYLPSSTKLWYENTIQRREQIHFPYFYSIPICTLWKRLSQKGKKSDPSFHSWEELVTSYLQGRCGVKPQST
jgi:hypothetical protein